MEASSSGITQQDTEPFPALDTQNDAANHRSPNSKPDGPGSPIANRPAASSSLSGRLRRVSQSFGQSDIPEGFFAATGGIASSIFTRQAVPRAAGLSVSSSAARRAVPNGDDAMRPTTPIQPGLEEGSSKTPGNTSSGPAALPTLAVTNEPLAAAPFPNGYHFPPKHSCVESTKLGGNAFWGYFLTPVGFLVTIYGLNVVAWGGMLFLLLCNASPAMCHPTCNDINSPRRKWIEYDSQILNALFCVTGFGLAPWRFRDLYFLLQYRLMKKPVALRRLAGIHHGWFRLGGSTELPVDLGPQNVGDASASAASLAIPYPENKIPDPPLTGVRAPATALWKLDLVIWLMVWNTFLQCCLAGFMWALNRYNRPSWSTGLFVALGCTVAAVGGLIMFLEGKAVKGIEGVPISEKDKRRLERDREQGIWHYNNIKDKDMEEKYNGKVRT